MTARDKTRPFTTKSAEAMRDRVISEPTAFFEAKPGHEKELVAAAPRGSPRYFARQPSKRP